jgi:hypothetical protein
MGRTYPPRRNTWSVQEPPALAETWVFRPRDLRATTWRRPGAVRSRVAVEALREDGWRP